MDIGTQECFERLAARSRIKEGSSCVEWVGAPNIGGYGIICVGSDAAHRKDRKWLLAHRASYLHFVGDIPSGMLVCHTCDNRMCINPMHLFVGTARDNTADMRAKGRHQRGSRHWMARINEDLVVEMREMHRSGLPISDIARKFGVNEITARDAIVGITWAWVPCKL